MEVFDGQPEDLEKKIRGIDEANYGKAGPEDAELLSNLRQKGFVITETHTGEKFGDKVDEAGFEELSKRERIQLYTVALACEKYYFGLLVEDPFDRNALAKGMAGADAIRDATEQRLAFQTQMLRDPNVGPAFRRYESRAKIRLAPITAVWGPVASLAKTLASHTSSTPQAKKVFELALKLPIVENLATNPPSNYSRLSRDEKLKIVAQMDSIAGSMLELLRHRIAVPEPGLKSIPGEQSPI